MQQQLKNNRALETFKIFPFIAWALIIGFAFFVYHITMELKDITKTLQEHTHALQAKANTPVADIEDFEL